MARETTTTQNGVSPPAQEFESDTLIIADQSLRLGFIQLPKLILYARNVSRDAKLLYAILLGYAWQEGRCFPGYGRLCYDMGASENTVRVYMRELEKVGLLQQRRRGLGKTNIYLLLDLRTAKIDVQEPQNPRTAKTEALDPTKTAVAEPAKTDGELETEEVELDQQQTDQYSNKRRTITRHKTIDPQGYGKLRVQNNVDNLAEPELGADGGSEPDDESLPPARSVGMAKIASVLKQRQLTPAGAHMQGNGAGRGRPPKAPDYLAATMADLSAKLHDDAPRSSLTLAVRLWKASGLPEDKFVQRLYEAKSITQQQGSVKGTPAKSDRQLRNRVPYFFAVVEDLIGLKEPPATGS